MVAGAHPERLEVGGVAAGLLVELGVGHGDGIAADHEGERVAGSGRALEALVEGQHRPSDPSRDGPLQTRGTALRR